MQHRHLLPDEVDQLLDGASGLDAAPLRAHLAGCPDCTRQLADARIVCEALDALQHLAPSPRFTASVMAQVQVLEPWHVALANGAQRLMSPAEMGELFKVIALTRNVDLPLMGFARGDRTDSL